MRRKGNKVPEESKKEKHNTLVAENRKLRKEVQQLRKQLNRYSGREEQINELVEYLDSPEHKQEVESKDESYQCTKCKGSVTTIDLPHGRYWSCTACDNRGKF